MNFRLCTGFAAIVCLSLASCHPYDEGQKHKKATKGPEKTATTIEQQKLKEAEAKKKAEEEIKKKEEAVESTTPDPTGNTVAPTGGGETKPTGDQKRPEYPVAGKVPGKEGYVFSPYNSKIISVRDEQDRLIPSGTLVMDPTYPPSEKKYFRVP